MKDYLKRLLWMNIFVGLFMLPTHASTPVWTFSAPNPSHVTVSPGTTATVTYTVTNQSSMSKILVEQGSGLGLWECQLAPKGAPGSSCTITLTIDGNNVPKDGIHRGPILCNLGGTQQCYQPSLENSLSVSLAPEIPSLSSSVKELVLAVGGKSRIITITNNSGNATPLAINASLPPGTTINTSTSTCYRSRQLAAYGSCTLVVQPGATATSTCTTGIAPTPGVVSVSAPGYSAVSIQTLVLGYGCQYQGGFLFAIDDNTPETSNMGGKVVSLVDQADPSITQESIIWSSNGNGPNASDVSYDLLPGITNNVTINYATFNAWYSTSYLSGLPQIPQCSNTVTADCLAECTGLVEGVCNTKNILAFYNYYHTNFDGTVTSPQLGVTSLTDYAAGLCSPVGGIAGYTDWYLPAICELDSGISGAACPSGTQSMTATLSFLLGDTSAQNPSESCNPPLGTQCLVGSYWSSTQRDPNSSLYAFYALLDFAGSYQFAATKEGTFGVRCARALTF